MAHIVVIEDNEQSARMVAKLLRHTGHEVWIAQSGEEGLSLVFESTPDLILIDLGLPDLDGQTVVALLRQQEHLANVPLVAFTAWPPDQAYAMARAYGCDGVIIKPIDTRVFANQIGEYLQRVN